jgi:hypothetical protein
MPDPAQPDASAPDATARVTVTATGVRIDIDYRVYRSSDVADGDTYHVRLVAVTGETLADHQQTVNYTPYYPNGPDCDRDPCWSAGVKF